MKYIINLYGENYDQLIAVANRLSSLSTIDVVYSVTEINHCGIIISKAIKNHLFKDETFYNHYVNSNDYIDDDYIIKIILGSFNLFFNFKDEEDV